MNGFQETQKSECVQNANPPILTNQEKKCPRCERILPSNKFYKSKQTKSGLRCFCIECERKTNTAREPQYGETRKKYRQSEKYKELKRKSYIRNKDRVLETNTHYRSTQQGRFGMYRRAAKKRNFEFSISFEYFCMFWQTECSYCGDAIKTIGIDRIDNKLGYVVGNIVSCCRRCNIMKREMSVRDFVEHIKKIYLKVIK